MEEYRSRVHMAALSYERNRFYQSVLDSLPAVILAAAMLLIHFRLLNAAIAALIVLGSVTFRWIGKQLGKGLGPGIFLAWVPLLLPLVPRWINGCCGADECSTLCSYACGSAGIITGFWLARIHVRLGNRLGSWMVSAGVLTASAIAGCPCVRFSTTMTFVITLLLSSVVGSLIRRRSVQEG